MRTINKRRVLTAGLTLAAAMANMLQASAAMAAGNPTVLAMAESPPGTP